jgi:2-dehydropantoate 2-reductase
MIEGSERQGEISKLSLYVEARKLSKLSPQFTRAQQPMKLCIYGAGAIGGYMAVALADAGCDVSLIDQGDQLEAIRSNGLILRTEAGDRQVDIPCHASPDDLPPQDYVIIAVKSWAVPGIIDGVESLLHDTTSIVSVNNGIPWWYFQGLDSVDGPRSLHSVDPDGQQWARFGAERAIGCVVYPACRIASPGVIEHVSGNRFALGEPGGAKSERVKDLAGALREGGLKALVKTDIRSELWVKLIGNLAFNPLSVLTGNTLHAICENPDTRAQARAMMLEAKAVGEALGARFAIDVDQRIDGAAAVGEHKTSMLQDYEAGAPLELDTLVHAVQELAQRVGLTTPAIDTVMESLQEKLQPASSNPAAHAGAS